MKAIKYSHKYGISISGHAALQYYDKFVLKKEPDVDEIVTIIRQRQPKRSGNLLKNSEIKAIRVLEAAFANNDLESYVFAIQDYYADETDQLAEDNPEMEDYLNNIIPEFTEKFNLNKRNEWLNYKKLLI